ncbi:MAG: DUF2497 domain-containing protein [Rhizobiaceae bacterium]|nr:DUF2497 domain-containing protein [Rhizobiaceae bacterium]
MAQANVAREPSMEEILASIRKIIESNEDTAETAPEAIASDRPAAGSSIFGAREAEPPLSVINAAPAFRAPSLGEPSRTTFSGATTPKTSVPTATPPTTSSVTSTSASSIPATAASAPSAPAVTRSYFTAEDKKTGPTGTDRPLGDKSTFVANSAAARSIVSSKVSPAAAPDVEASTPYKSRQSDGLVSGDKISATASAVAAAPPAPEIAKTDPVATVRKEQMPTNTSAQATPRREDALISDEGRALISAEAGAKVAASFGNLNHAVSHGPTRSFDEIAEEMLQPMLQEWLDDNLPTLVERLVREEIERVARGR